MSDHEAIRALCCTYAFHLDEGEFAAVGALLADATLRPAMAGVRGQELRGRDEIERFYREQVITYKGGRPMTRHLITNQLIELGADAATARSRCYFTVLQRPTGLPFQLISGGQYHDAFAKVDGVWRFTEKVIQVDHLNDIGLHFRIAEERRSPA